MQFQQCYTLKIRRAQESNNNHKGLLTKPESMQYSQCRENKKTLVTKQLFTFTKLLAYDDQINKQ